MVKLDAKKNYKIKRTETKSKLWKHQRKLQVRIKEAVGFYSIND